MGPLFACIIKRQFEKLRDGDRFFFSHRRSGQPTRPQGLFPIAKGNIQGRSLGAIICDNIDIDIDKAMGREVFRTPDSKTNPQLDCRKLKPGKGTLSLSEIFNEAVTEPDGLSEILSKDAVEKELDEGFVQSINFPRHYFNDFDQEAKLQVDEGYVVELTFEFFELENDNSTLFDCRFDFVEIFESNTKKGTYAKLCGDEVPKGETFRSLGNEMTVRFHSDSSITGRGFNATWKEVPIG